MGLNYFCCLNKITWHLEDILFPVPASLLPGPRLFLIGSFQHLGEFCSTRWPRDGLSAAHRIPPVCHQALTSVPDTGNWRGGFVEGSRCITPSGLEGEGQRRESWGDGGRSSWVSTRGARPGRETGNRRTAASVRQVERPSAVLLPVSHGAAGPPGRAGIPAATLPARSPECDGILRRPGLP